MGTGVGLILVAAGAILAWAVDVSTTGFTSTRSATSCSSSESSGSSSGWSSGLAGQAPVTSDARTAPAAAV